MVKRLSNWLSESSKGWVALSALVIFVLFAVFILPAQSAKSEEKSGGAGSPDMSLFYSPENLYQWAEEYGSEGRKAYIRARFTFDMIFPVVYALFLTTGISWIFKKAFPPESFWQRMNLTPLLGAGFDYLENLSTSLVIGRFPNRTMVIDQLAPMITLVKWIFVGGSFLLLLIGTATGIERWIKEKGR